jgi:hypothetical protein
MFQAPIPAIFCRKRLATEGSEIAVLGTPDKNGDLMRTLSSLRDSIWERRESPG